MSWLKGRLSERTSWDGSVLIALSILALIASPIIQWVAYAGLAYGIFTVIKKEHQNLSYISNNMKDEYTLAFTKVVQQTVAETGFSIPYDVETYIIALLSSHVEKSNFLPKESFTESYFKLTHKSSYSAKELGDTCLILSGVFPEYGEKTGLNKTYYDNIGKSSYEQASRILNRELFYMLYLHFDLISAFINITTSSPVAPIIIGGRDGSQSRRCIS